MSKKPKWTLTESHREAIRKALSKPYRFYHKDRGYIEGENLLAFCKSEPGLRHSTMRSVMLGNLYKSNGFYQSKETYESRELWEEQNPLYTSDYPGVTYHRTNKCWYARHTRKNDPKFSKRFKTEQEAIDALKDFKAKHNID